LPVEVHIVTPEREVWTGTAEMLIARGVDGEVGILGGHAPLLVQLAIGPLKINREDGTSLRAVIDGGFLHVGTHEGVTRADVLAAQAEMADEVDVEAARARAAELTGQLGQGRDTERAESEIEGVKAALQKAQARINLAG
jgi:F-type H+-transporting ATPase subunit epsilon